MKHTFKEWFKYKRPERIECNSEKAINSRELEKSLRRPRRFNQKY